MFEALWHSCSSLCRHVRLVLGPRDGSKTARENPSLRIVMPALGREAPVQRANEIQGEFSRVEAAEALAVWEREYAVRTN